MNKNLTIGLAIIICAAVYGLYLLIPAATGTYNSYKDFKASQAQLASLKQQISDLEKAKNEHVQKESATTKPIYKNDGPGGSRPKPGPSQRRERRIGVIFRRSWPRPR